MKQIKITPWWADLYWSLALTLTYVVDFDFYPDFDLYFDFDFVVDFDIRRLPFWSHLDVAS